MSDCDPAGADPAWQVLIALRDCLCELLPCTELGQACRCVVEPGRPAFDHCCTCETARNGQAWVREVRRYPTGNPFPAQAFGADCGAQLAVEIELGIIRCTPGPDAAGLPPSAEHLEQNAYGLGQDAQALLLAVCCADLDMFSLGALVRFDPSGQCAGSALTVTVAL